MSARTTATHSDYVLTLLSDRHDVSGGESSIYRADGITRVCSTTLEKLGDFMLLHDSLTKHGVTSIECASAAYEGHRDVLVVMYSRVLQMDDAE